VEERSLGIGILASLIFIERKLQNDAVIPFQRPDHHHDLPVDPYIHSHTTTHNRQQLYPLITGDVCGRVDEWRDLRVSFKSGGLL